MGIVDELERLQQLFQSGALTDAEFAAAKARLLWEQSRLDPSLDEFSLEQFAPDEFAPQEDHTSAGSSDEPLPDEGPDRDSAEAEETGADGFPDFESESFPEIESDLVRKALPPPSKLDRETRQWAVLLHLSQYMGILAPGIGLLFPLVIWLGLAPRYPGLDPHGKALVNWFCSVLLYTVISILLIPALVGVLMLLLLALLCLIVPIIAAYQVSHGKRFKYPLAIEFIR